MGNMSAVFRPGTSSGTRPPLPSADPAVADQAPAEAQLIKAIYSVRSSR